MPVVKQGAGPVVAKAGSYPATPVLSPRDRNVANRLSYGITPELAAEVRAAGSGLKWFNAQVRAAKAAPYVGPDWWPDLHRQPRDIWRRQVNETRGSWMVSFDQGARALVRRILSPQQVLEVMDEFWQNHFHVPAGADNVGLFRASYAETIRRHALGRFDRLLKAAILHPAMLFYLNAASSTKMHPNENLGRELLELHTLGIGNYRERDVRDSSRILTGYWIDEWKTWATPYRKDIHYRGKVRVLGFKHANRKSDGRKVTAAYLNYLAHHPATAKRIARKLIAAFVSDEPQPALEARLARVYLANDTEIVPVVRAMIRSAEFAGAAGTKLRDADEDTVGAYRMLGITPRPPRGDDESGPMQMYWQTETIGLEPGGWPRPDGQPVDGRIWSSPSRVLASMGVHWTLAGSWYPDAHLATFREPVSWLPERRIAFADLVDHLTRTVLQVPSTPELLSACCAATGYRPDQMVTKSDDLFGWRWPRLMVTLLDSPEFFYR